MIYQYLDLYGDRNLAELKLETPTLRDQPTIFIELLKGQLNASMTLEGYLKTKRKNKQEAYNKLKSRIRTYGLKDLQLRILISLATYFIKNRENMRFARTRSFGVVKTIFLEIGKRMANDGTLENSKDVFYLDVDHLKRYCNTKDTTDLKGHVTKQKNNYNQYSMLNLPDRIMFPKGNEPFFGGDLHLKNEEKVYSGLPVSKGKVLGEAIVIHQPDYDFDVKDKIIITRMTDPGWIFLMSQAAGIICERGSLLSHTAIIGRELGIPVIVDVKHATERIRSGQLISMDGTTGVITLC
jgi:pyruvate,water dikinase